MHYTGTVYRNPYEPPSPLLEITQGCSHNRCKFCNMYSDVKFKASPMEWIEEDLKELAESDPSAKSFAPAIFDPTKKILPVSIQVKLLIKYVNYFSIMAYRGENYLESNKYIHENLLLYSAHKLQIHYTVFFF